MYLCGDEVEMLSRIVQGRENDCCVCDMTSEIFFKYSNSHNISLNMFITIVFIKGGVGEANAISVKYFVFKQTFFM